MHGQIQQKPEPSSSSSSSSSSLPLAPLKSRLTSSALWFGFAPRCRRYRVVSSWPLPAAKYSGVQRCTHSRQLRFTKCTQRQIERETHTHTERQRHAQTNTHTHTDIHTHRGTQTNIHTQRYMGSQRTLLSSASMSAPRSKRSFAISSCPARHASRSGTYPCGHQGEARERGRGWGERKAAVSNSSTGQNVQQESKWACSSCPVPGLTWWSL